jgi:hypothetical protein
MEWLCKEKLLPGMAAQPALSKASLLCHIHLSIFLVKVPATAGSAMLDRRKSYIRKKNLGFSFTAWGHNLAILSPLLTSEAAT